MKKLRAIVFMPVLSCMVSYGQNDSSARKNIDMDFQMRGSFKVEKQPGEKPGARFRMDDFRWNIEGKAGKKLRYRFRQSFTTTFESMSIDNLLSSVNYAFIKWSPVENAALTFGKQVFALGGHEFWALPLYVISFSDFGSSLAAYQMGISAEWDYRQGQNLTFQICNLHGKDEAGYYTAGLPDGISPTGFPCIYTLNWNGAFLPEGALELRYSASLAKEAKHSEMLIISLGQSLRKEKWGAYFDLMWSRQDIDASGILSRAASFKDGMPRTLTDTEYLSAVGYAHFFISPRFNAFVKGAGECGGLYAPFAEAGKGICRVNWNGQLCFQYMPTCDRNFRIFTHYDYYGSKPVGDGSKIGITPETRHLLSFGIIYSMDVL